MNKIIFTAFLSLIATAVVHAQIPVKKRTENKGRAEIIFSNDVHDFNTILQSKPVSYTFNFRNTGTEPLIITSVSASCGCTQPDWSKEPIKPGGGGFVRATFNAAMPGVFEKQVTVISNAKSATRVLTLRGEVKTPAKPAPAAVIAATAPKPAVAAPATGAPAAVTTTPSATAPGTTAPIYKPVIIKPVVPRTLIPKPETSKKAERAGKPASRTNN